MNRTEHLQWCKDRAFKYVENGDYPQTFASMASDLGKHDETANHVGIQLGMGLMITGDLNTSEKMHKFIDGFN